jgi:histidinol-phosphate aminotransferase
MAWLTRREWLSMVGLVTGGSIFSQGLAASTPGDSAASRAAKRPLRLSLNENPFGPAPSAVQAVQQELANLCRYTDTGFDELLGAIGAGPR